MARFPAAMCPVTASPRRRSAGPDCAFSLNATPRPKRSRVASPLRLGDDPRAGQERERITPSPSQPPDNLAVNVAVVRRRIGDACARAGRDPAAVSLLPVTKTHPPERIVDLMALGFRAFGENRPQELRDKAAWFASRSHPLPEWHFIGTLQRNKIRHLRSARVALFHGLDSLALAQALEADLARHGGDLDALLEVNVSGEATKHGLTPGEAPALLRAVAGMKHLRLRGLMTMAPLEAEPEATRPVFRGLRLLRDRLQDELDCRLPILSMGMSNDFEVAIEEGATVVRLGSILFGPREAARP